MSVTCPKCGLISPLAVAECECGYNFATGKSTPRPKPPTGPRSAEKSAAAYLVFLLAAACCWGWMIFTLAYRGSHPSTTTAVGYFLVLLLLVGGFGYSFLWLPQRSGLNQMILLSLIATLMGVSGSFAWQLGLAEDRTYIAAVFGAIALTAGLFLYASRWDKQR
jgi:FtsH-binding integral membrane protein